SDSAYLASVFDQIPGPVLAVGHSYGGAVITNAATTARNVVGLVYVAAPEPRGETYAERCRRPEWCERPSPTDPSI
ncbi:MAG TPA: alpha/beta hydrolase, partial [Terriglobales bacterium]|nr:alpha/beta hydrolase [Terriglobales bacterium]